MYDSWMSMDASGRVSPRASLNRAWDAFSEAARIQPTYEPAYGRLIDVQDLAERAYDLGACPGFDLVTDEIRPPWARWTPSDQARAFCPAVLDSITWLTRAEFASADRARLRAGADRLSRETENALKRWGSFSPRQSRPLEQLADLLMSRRTRFEVASPERLRVMAADALELASSALSLATDTSAAQLTNLANLYLASGQQEMAVGLAREIVALYADSLRLAPKNLLNVLVAAGQTTAALRVAAGPGGWRGFRDSESGGFISYAGAESTLTRLRVLGALGVSGPIIQAELDSLDQKLGGAGYPPRERQLLRDSATLRLMPSLAADPAALRRWAAGVSVDRPLWQGLALAATDTAQAIAHLERAQEAGSSGLGDATESFLLGVLAGRLGRRAEAVQHLSRLDSIPHRLDEAWEIGWGLQVLSHLLRGEHYEVLGEFANALEQYQLFQSARMWPDSISGNAGERAMSGIRRVSNGR
jgi:tetratricopeptide (TPR) repeat protein